MKIQLNGEPTEVPDAVTIEQLLERLGVDPRRVAVEHNLTIIKRHRQAETVVNEGDEVEIVNFVGGWMMGSGRGSRFAGSPNWLTGN